MRRRSIAASDRGQTRSVDEVAAGGMSWAEVALVLRALNEADIRYWLQGGWGVDALVGRQTRSHRDLDVDLDQTLEAEALDVLTQLGYAVETTGGRTGWS